MRTQTEIQTDIDKVELKKAGYEMEAVRLKAQVDDKNNLKVIFAQLKSGFEAEKILAEQGIKWREEQAPILPWKTQL